MDAQPPQLSSSAPMLPTAPYVPSANMRHPLARERRLLFHQQQQQDKRTPAKARHHGGTSVGGTTSTRPAVVPLSVEMVSEAAAMKLRSHSTVGAKQGSVGEVNAGTQGSPRPGGHVPLLLPAVTSPGGSAVSVESQRRLSPKPSTAVGGSPLDDQCLPLPVDGASASTKGGATSSSLQLHAAGRGDSSADAPSADDLLAWLAANGNANNNQMTTDDNAQPLGTAQQHLLLPRIANNHKAHKATSWSSRVSSNQRSAGRGGSEGTVDADGTVAVAGAPPNAFLLSQRVTGYSREQHIKYMEAFIARQCASSRGLDARADGYCRALDAVCDLNPALVNIYSTVKHFLKDVVHTTHNERQHHAENIVAMRKRTHAEQQQFYEEKFVKALSEKSEWQRKCKVLSEELMELKKSRDADLMQAKTEVLGAVHKIHEDEEDMQSMRSLVTTIFKVNRENELRVNQLQDCLIANRIAIPPRYSEDEQDAKRTKKKNRTQKSPTEADGAVEADSGAGDVSPGSGPQATSPTTASVASVSPTAAHASSKNGASHAQKGGAAPGPAKGNDDDDEDNELQRFMQPRLRDQVSLDFLAASKRELEQCRLSTQRVLVTCASETQSSYKLLVASLTAENQRLKHELQQLREAKDGLERFVHEKRFAQRARQEADCDEKMLAGLDSTLDMGARQRLVLNRDGSPAGKPLVPPLPTLNIDAIPHAVPAGADDVPREQLTPRPALPFEIQPALGVDLRQPTARLTTELAAAALNLKAQLEEMHVRVRRLATCVSWMDEWTVNRVIQQDDPPFLPVAPTAEWDHCHHFLRTTVQPHVPNLKWTPAFTSYLVMKFFEGFENTREAARWERDVKMLAPRVFQPYERRFHALVPLDATIEELANGPVDRVPLGYVVSQFLIKEMLVSDNDRASCVADMVQSRATVPKLMHRFLEVPLELELAKVSYNLWFAVRKYRAMEPLCGLFIDVVEGRLPPNLFGMMQHVSGVLHKKLLSLDAAKSGLLTYKQITTATHNMLTDYEPEVQRGAVFAIAQTLEAKGVSLIGTVSISELMSDEKRHVPRRSGSTTTTAAIGVQLLANAAQASLPNAPNATVSQVLAGASIFTKYLRRLVMQRCDAVYRHMEAVTYPCVRESVAVKGMFLLRLSTSVVALAGGTAAVVDDGATTVPNTSLTSPMVPPLAAGHNNPHRDPSGSYHRSPGVLGTSATAIFTPPARTLLERESHDVPEFDSGLAAESNDPRRSLTPNPMRRPSVGPQPVAGHVHDVADDTPPFLHVASVPICLGDVAMPRQKLVATPDPQLVANFNSIVERLPHYSSSVHFPDVAGGATGEGQKDSKNANKMRKQKSFVRNKTQQTMQQVAANDQDWVEWYSFLCAMRSTALRLPDVCTKGWAPGGDGSASPNRADVPAASIPPMPPGLMS